MPYSVNNPAWPRSLISSSPKWPAISVKWLAWASSLTGSLGYLHSQSDADYMSKTTLAFLEDQVTKLDAKICRQLFRLCVELSMVAHVTATTVPGANEETLKRLRTKCVKDVKNTIGNIRYDDIYAHQHSQDTEDDDV